MVVALRLPRRRHPNRHPCIDYLHMNADTIQIASYKGFRDGYAVGEYANPYDSNDPNHVQYEEGYDCGISAYNNER